MSEWQPIETIPKPSGNVLAWQAGGPIYIASFDGDWWTDCSDYNDHYYSPTCRPTHWMPLPSPPEQAVRSEKSTPQ